MKKLLMLALSLSIFACSKKEDDPKPKETITPPVTVTGPIVTVTTTVVGTNPEPVVDTLAPQSVDYKLYVGASVVEIKAPFKYVLMSNLVAQSAWLSTNQALAISVPDVEVPRQKWDSVFLSSSFDILTEKDKNRNVYYTNYITTYNDLKMKDSLVVMFNEHVQYNTGPYDPNNGIRNTQMKLSSDFTEINTEFLQHVYPMKVTTKKLYNPNNKANFNEYYVEFKNCRNTNPISGYSEWRIDFNFPGMKGYK